MLTTVMNGARQSPGSAGATDTAADDRTRSRPNRADDHSAVNTPCEPPRTRPTATPSPRPRTDVSSEKGLLHDFRHTICVWVTR